MYRTKTEFRTVTPVSTFMLSLLSVFNASTPGPLGGNSGGAQADRGGTV